MTDQIQPQPEQSNSRGKPTAAQSRILAVLERAGREMTAGEVRIELGARSRAAITTALRNLAAAGLVVVRDDGGTDWYRERFYRVAKSRS